MGGLAAVGAGKVAEVDIEARRFVFAVDAEFLRADGESAKDEIAGVGHSGTAATDDLEEGHLTQTWLAVSNDPGARVSGGYWFHRQRQAPAAEATSVSFQDQLVSTLAKMTGVTLA